MTGRAYCIFSAQYLPHMGGVELFTHDLAHALAEAGDRAMIVTCSGGDEAGFSSEGEAVDVCRLPGFSLLSGRLPWPRKNGVFRRLLSELDGRCVDGVLINTRFYPLSLIGAQFARNRGLTPLVLDHGSAPLTIGNPLLDRAVQGWERAMTRKLKRYGPDFYGISESSSRWLGELGVASKGEIPNAIDASAFRACASTRSFRKELGIGDDVFLVSFVGRLVPEKGVDLFLEVAATLLDEPFAFVVAGEGPLRDRIAERALGNTIAVGRLDRSDVAALLQQSDALLLPTRSEGFCTTLLEAGACSAAPIVTPVGGAQEVLGESYGFPCLLQAPTAESARESLIALRSDDEARFEIAASICHRVETMFSWKATVALLQAAFRSAEAGALEPASSEGNEA